MTKEQFKQLADVFWKSATAPQLTSAYHGYQSALDDIPPDALDAAIRRSLRSCTNMPRPAQLRDWARETMPKAETRVLQHDGPCAYCKAKIRPAGYADGSAIRYYIEHTDRCPHPSMTKPDNKVWYEDSAAA